MNSIIKKSALSLAMLAGLSSQAFAADVEAGVVKRAQTLDSYVLEHSMFNDSAMVSELQNALVRHEPTEQTLGPAQGISYFNISGVISTQYPQWDQVSNRTSTNQDHGGAEIYISVVQYGYGNIGSYSLPGTSPSLFRTNYLCGSLSSLHICSVGETITGWEYIYRATNFNNGTFSINANSTAWPYGFWSDSVYIR